ncbi:MAG TPA: hypothetical protein VNL91_09595 [Thermoanaerobaculia bacterium]|nr:hypothetical protein [Thermoanaerobaculia bacterium]
MAGFLEAVVMLFPLDLGGPAHEISPREGSYRPFARVSATGERFRVRMIEGPPLLAPGDTARAVFEIESDITPIAGGSEADLIELEGRIVGAMTVVRHWHAGRPLPVTA